MSAYFLLWLAICLSSWVAYRYGKVAGAAETEIRMTREAADENYKKYLASRKAGA